MFLLAASFAFAQKQFQNGQAARAVVGQFTFSKGDQNPTGQVLGGVGGVAWAANRLFVADSNRIGAAPNNNRVMVFDTTQIPSPYQDITLDTAVQSLGDCYVCGVPAIYNLGQDTLTPPTYTPSGQSNVVTAFYNGYNGNEDQPASQPAENAWLFNAAGVATDGVRLAVADTDNNRVLLWNSIPGGNQHPDLVVGQPDFNTLQVLQQGTVTATSMRGPQGVWIANNKLYVADTQNSRVLIWNSWPTHNNQSPDVVLGQPNFNTANAPPASTTAPTAAANQLWEPTSVTADGGHVYVSDLGFNRVMIWNTISPTTDQNADVVIGQPNFTQTTANNVEVCYTTPGGSTVLPTGTQGQCQASLDFPRFVLSDGTRLFIADSGNDRVLIFNSIPTKTGTSADLVLGQTNFTNDIVTSAAISIVSTQVDNTGGVDVIASPSSLAWDGINLYVADPYNRRVVMFTEGDTPLPSPFNSSATTIPVVNWASEIVRQEGFVTFTVATGGKITTGDTATITIGSPSSTTTNTYTYTEKSSDTTDSIAKALVTKINATNQDVVATFGGAGTGTVYLSSVSRSGAENSALGYDTISLAASVSNTLNITAIASGQYLSAGNAATASPGALVEVNAPGGVTFTDVDSTYIAPLNSPTNNGLVPATVNGVQLYMDGFASPLYKVSPKQLVGQIPYSFGDRNSTSVYVRTVHNNGQVTVTSATPVYIAPANPGIFDQQQYPGQQRPWQISQALHQQGNPEAVISIDGSATAADELGIFVNGSTTPYTYTVQTNDTLQNVVTGLVNAVNNGNDQYVTASAGGSFTRVVLTAKSGPFSGGNSIPIGVSTGTTSAGLSNCTTTTTAATETMTPYNYTGTEDSLCHSWVATCCAVASGTPIFPANPAVPGELIGVFAAGLGDIQNTSGSDITSQLTTGQPNTVTDIPANDVLSANFVAATLGGSSAQVISAGLPKDSYGTYRVDVLIPSTTAANPQTPFYMAQNAFISNTVYLPVGAAVQNPPSPPPPVPASPINLSIDTPVSPLGNNVTTVSGTVSVAGWAVSSSAAVTNVAVQMDGVTVANLTTANGYYGVSRPDVCASYPGVFSCPNVGYNYPLDTTNFANGGHTLQILVTDANGNNRANPQGVSLFIDNDPTQSPTHIDIDTPTTFGEIYHGVVMFSGWATNDVSPIVSFKAYMDGTPVDPTQIVYGISRPDVCAVVASTTPGCPNVGWNYLADLTKLTNSNLDGSTFQHIFSIEAIAQNGGHFTASSAFYVNNYNPNDLYSGPTVTLDIPSTSAGVLSGTTTLAGWAIDPYEPIQTVQYSIDGVIMGTVPYSIGRPDVCTAFANQTNFSLFNCPFVGFLGSFDTTLIADGKHTLGITATPFQGQPYTLTRSISIANLNSSANPVRIGIDSPLQTSTLSSLTGTATVAGWSLTDSGSSEGISSVSVSVDGTLNGEATYGWSRPDVCAAFPNRPGCPNVGFTYALDTTHLTNGTHALEITSSTPTGKRASASAQFTVSNSSPSAMIAIDYPNGRSIPVSGILTTSGWAIKSGVRITSVTITVDNVPVGTALPVSRPDVCAAYPGQPQCPNVGWTFFFDTSALIDGQHILGVIALAADGTADTNITSFTVQNWTAGAILTGNIDSPTASQPYYTGTVAFGGWFVGAGAQVSTVQVASVSVTIDGIPYSNAALNSRPDVCAVYPTAPACPNVGWSLTLNTSLLTDDVHTMGVTATTTTGQSYTMTQTFTSEN